MRRLRLVLVSRLVAGDPRRWAIYLGLMTGRRLWRRLTRGGPEVVYRGVLRPGQRLDMHAEDPLPRRFRSRQLRKRLEADARADLEAAAAAR